MHRMLAVALLAASLAAAPAIAAPTRSSAIAVAPAGASGDVVFVVNPDSDSVARIEFDVMHAGTLTHEAKVGRYPRTVALAGSFAFTADQNGGTVSRLNQADLSGATAVDLGFGCNPYGVAATPDQRLVLATCQGTSDSS
jgi:DNA-binding beta-propeller fold protein YncE